MQPLFNKDIIIIVNYYYYDYTRAQLLLLSTHKQQRGPNLKFKKARSRSEQNIVKQKTISTI